MFPGAMALLERSLRTDARAWGPHLARFVLMVAIYFSVIYAVAMMVWFGAPGHRFFSSIAYLNLVFMTLLGMSFFSTAITEEKEEDTLGLMLMAGISPVGILLGKSGGRLFQGLLLIAVQYPFTLLAITMGGITQVQVQATCVAMFAYIVFLAGIGLACSTLAQRNRSASMRMLVVIVLYWLVPLICWETVNNSIQTNIFHETILEWISQSCIFLQMDEILTTGFGETIWSHQVITNLLMGCLGFLFSWAMFGVAAQQPLSEPTTRGLMTRSGSSFWWLSPGHPWRNPMIWKDFYFVTGGKAAILIRFVLYPSIYLVAYLMISDFFGGGWGDPPEEAMTGIYLFLTMIAVAIDAGLVVSRSLHEEIRAQTLATLTLLPISTGRILYSKIAGSLLGWLPGAVCLYLGMLVLPYGPKLTGEFFEDPGIPFFFISHLILVPHVAAALAMYVRWGALPLAICLAIGSLFLSVITIEMIAIGPDSAMFFILGLATLTLCGVCHIVVYLRAEALATR